MSTSHKPVDPSIMEIYKMAVEMADRVSQRRATANAFFLTVNTTLVSVSGLLPKASGASSLVAICAAGAIVSGCWWILLGNYRKLNAAKFEVINSLERNHLPVQPFNDEWKLLGQTEVEVGHIKKLRTQFRQLGKIERFVPIVFIFLYLGFLVWGAK